MNLQLNIQIAVADDAIPLNSQFEQWATAAVAHPHLANGDNLELTIRVVDEQEMQCLNKKYRGGANATNVLAFPFGACAAPAAVLGDVVICATVVTAEAKAQNKPTQNHWAHMVIHGILHLCDYDHIETTAAKIMENLETEILSSFNIPCPYEISNN